MITWKDLYSVLSAVVPLYMTMFLAYASVKWWKIFSPEQCSGINRFVAIFAIPFLSFEFISKINPYKMDILFLAADSLSKILILSVLVSWAIFTPKGSLDWVITSFSLSTLPNTLVMGIPLLKSMYGDDQEHLMIQVVVLQSIIWYTLLLFLLEYREAKILTMQRFNAGGGTNNSESSGKIERSDDRKGAQKIGEDEGVHVIVSRSSNFDSTAQESSTANDLDQQKLQNINKVAPDSREDGKEFHMFLWGCRCCNSQAVCEQSVQVCSTDENFERKETSEKSDLLQHPSMSSEMKLIMKMVWFKLVRNPNTYASLLGLSWALASCRWGIKKPQILDDSVTILSNAGLGMAMFSLGMFMAGQPRIIACGSKLAVYGLLMRFVAGPAVMAVASIGVGLKGTILKVSIVQAALPQGIVPFVFAKEYNLHPDLLSTGVIFGMLVSLPITILYYLLLGL